MQDKANNGAETAVDGETGKRAFPKLSDEQLTELEALGQVATYAEGDYLFQAGDRDVPFFVVRSGAVGIIDESGEDEERLAVMRERDIIGDLSTLEDRPAHASARVLSEADIVCISPENLQRIVSETSALSDIILRAFITRHELLRAADYTGVRVIGSRYTADTLRIREFLDRNQVIHTWIDLEENPDVHRLLRRLQVRVEETPVVSFGHQWVMRNPSDAELGEMLGLRKPVDGELYDLAVVGGGPAGLAAAVYAASEGLRTIVLERTAPGGQANASSKIENYLGFPTGLSGQELADRAALQAQKFGVQLTTPTQVTALSVDGYFPVLHIDESERISARCVLIATGADYRSLPVTGCDRYHGTGLYYAATGTEAMMCQDEQLVVVGGGNSAGQAAVFLSEHARRVLLLIREEELREGMSAYLADRIEKTDNIEVRTGTEIDEMYGESRLEAIVIQNNEAGSTERIETPAVFCFIGAEPRTEWLPSAILRDKKGFVLTGPKVETAGAWEGRRGPFYLETSVPGVFAAGDVRSGSVKRVASAVGEGAMAVQFVHEHLGQRA